MADKTKRLKITIGKFVTPVGVASWPKLTEPSTKFKPEGVYEGNLIFDAETGDLIREKLNKFLDDAVQKFKEEHPEKAKRIKPADLPLKDQYDEDGEETGNVILKTSRYASGTTKAGKAWKAKIKFADSKGRPINPKGLSLWSGSELRIYCTVSGYFVAKDNTVGIKLEIDAVQIRKLVSGGRDEVEVEALDDDDGYVHDGDEDGDDTPLDTDDQDENESVDF